MNTMNPHTSTPTGERRTTLEREANTNAGRTSTGADECNAWLEEAAKDDPVLRALMGVAQSVVVIMPCERRPRK